MRAYLQRALLQLFVLSLQRLVDRRHYLPQLGFNLMRCMPSNRSDELYSRALVLQVRRGCQAREDLGREQFLEQLCACARQELRKGGDRPLPDGGPRMREHGREHRQWLRLQVGVPEVAGEASDENGQNRERLEKCVWWRVRLWSDNCWWGMPGACYLLVTYLGQLREQFGGELLACFGGDPAFWWELRSNRLQRCQRRELGIIERESMHT